MMPPIKFQLNGDLWVGVGDRVWVSYGKPMSGIITGFDFDTEDSVDHVRIAFTSESGSQWTSSFSFGKIFDTERNAVLSHIKDLSSEHKELVRKSLLVASEIQHLREAWSNNEK